MFFGLLTQMKWEMRYLIDFMPWIYGHGMDWEGEPISGVAVNGQMMPLLKMTKGMRYLTRTRAKIGASPMGRVSGGIQNFRFVI
jgi:hypothetical protein